MTAPPDPAPDAAPPPGPAAPAVAPGIAIVLSTYNGALFLQAQLDSLLGQTVPGWTLYWRDDGSTDATPAILQAFMDGPGAGRCVAVPGPPGRIGPTGSFMTLLRAAAADGPDVVAFADQDDVWLPGKLAAGAAALAAASGPALYCSRQVLVDAALRRIGESAPLRHAPAFPAALTQNIATGCTVQLNRVAALLVASSAPPPSSLHDWWSYLVVAAAGGRLIADPTPAVLYRQHPGNLVGAPPGKRRRAVAALRRGPGVFMRVLRAHVTALRAQPHLLSPQAAEALTLLDRGLHGGLRHRVAALRLAGLQRQTWQETLLFRWWFLIG